MKMTFSRWALGATLFAMTAAPAAAQETRPQGDLPGPIDNLSDLQDVGKMIFKAADENNDGQISQKEAIDAGNLVVGGFFFRADANGDGILSQDEAKQAREAFFASKPWLRYVIQSASAGHSQRAQAGQPAAAGQPAPGGTNPIAALGAALDTNNDKQLQAGEVRKAVETTVQGLFATSDTNRDGQLTTAEVNAAVAGAARTVAQAAFQQADSDGNGQISQAEFEKAVLEPVRTAFQVLDLNHDGQLSQQEAQTARQVVMRGMMSLSMPEAGNSPRRQINSALGSPAGATPPATPGTPR